MGKIIINGKKEIQFKHSKSDEYCDYIIKFYDHNYKIVAMADPLCDTFYFEPNGDGGFKKETSYSIISIDYY